MSVTLAIAFFTNRHKMSEIGIARLVLTDHSVLELCRKNAWIRRAHHQFAVVEKVQFEVGSDQPIQKFFIL